MESGSEYRIPRPFAVKQKDSSMSAPVTTSSVGDASLEDVDERDGEDGELLNFSRRRRVATADF